MDLLTPTPKTPRISVNKLAEYLESTVTRRKSIVTDAKFPVVFKAGRYKDVATISESFISKHLSEDDVLERIDGYIKKKEEAEKIPNNEHEVQVHKGSAESLISLLDIDMSSLERLKIVSFPFPNKCVNFRGVDISVNPDLLIFKKVKDIDKKIGLLKLHFSKGNQLSDESQKIVGVLLNLYYNKFISSSYPHVTLDNKLCISLDVFKQKFEYCPSSIKVRIRRIEDACEEILLWWDKIKKREE